MTEETETPAPAVSWPRVIKLTHPVDFGSDRITSLEFRRGRIGDIKGMKLEPGSIQTDQLTVIAARLCGQPREVIEKLDADDAGEVLDVALDFLLKCLVPGKRR